jgi:hypothetical protein
VRYYEETGRRKPASQVAGDLLPKLRLARHAPASPHLAIFSDMTPLMLALRLRAGDMARADFDDERAKWRAEWEKYFADQGIAQASFGPYLWIQGWAQTATTEDEAKAALAALGDERLPPFRALEADMWVGRTYLLAGRPEAAKPLLEHVTSACNTLHGVHADTQAWALLGRARAALGDKQGACDAYDRVFERWKDAAGSITVLAVKKLRAAAGCP